MTRQVIYLEGNHYQMGYRHGQQVRPLRSQIMAAIEARFAQLKRDNPDQAFETLVRETKEVLHTIDQPAVDFIRGQADGLNLDFNRLLRYNLVAFLRDALTTRQGQTEGCTTWAAAGSAAADGQPILVKNRDYRLEHLALQLVVQAEPETGYRYTYVTSAGSSGVFVAGMNEAGLAVVDTHVSSIDVGPGLPAYALSMRILEEHRAVRSALAYLQTVPRLGRNNLLLADATGDIALFEMGYRHSAVLEAEADILVNTNHYRSPVMKSYFVDTNPQSLRGNSFQRYQLVKDKMTASHGHIDLSLAKQLMAAHAGPLASICRHPSPASEEGTIAGIIFQPAQRQMHVCHGQPCQETYSVFDTGVFKTGKRKSAAGFVVNSTERQGGLPTPFW